MKSESNSDVYTSNSDLCLFTHVQNVNQCKLQSFNVEYKIIALNKVKNKVYQFLKSPRK